MVQTLRPEIRAFYILTLAVVVTFGTLLFVAPGGADIYWPWNITAINSAYLIGSAYVGATVYFAIVLRLNDWSLARNAVGGLVLFSLVLLVATMLHWGRFRPYHPTTLVWLALYYVPPLAFPIFFRLQQLDAIPQEAGRTLAPAWRVWIVGRSAFYSLLTVIGIVFASQISQIWPWPIEPLDLRTFMGQVALNGWGGLVALADGFTWRRQRLNFLLFAIVGPAQLTGIVLGQATYSWSSPLGLALPLLFFEWTATAWALLGRYGWRDRGRGVAAQPVTQ